MLCVFACYLHVEAVCVCLCLHVVCFFTGSSSSSFGAGHTVPARKTHSDVREKYQNKSALAAGNAQQMPAMMMQMMAMMAGWQQEGQAPGGLQGLQLFGNTRKKQKMLEGGAPEASRADASSLPVASTVAALKDREVERSSSKELRESQEESFHGLAGKPFVIPEIKGDPPKELPERTAEESITAMANATRAREKKNKQAREDAEEDPPPKAAKTAKGKAKPKTKPKPDKAHTPEELKTPEPKGKRSQAKSAKAQPADVSPNADGTPMTAEKAPVMKKGDPTFFWGQGKVHRNDTSGHWRCFKKKSDKSDRKFKIGEGDEAEKASWVKALKWIEESS